MGKKDKNKKKVSGTVKTALKTEKKLNAKQKKELAALGEDDIEKVVAEIEREEARRQKVVEAVVAPPSRRVNFTITAHPFKDELIILGGEFYDGQKTVVYGDMFFYNINKNEWTVLKAPGAPPPRCAHQAIATPNNKGELWVFGGEFSSPSESQFYHYRDLWVYHIGDKKWEKITASGGPSARSGHRMIYMKKQLFVFGGFHDNLRDYKYFNDLHVFNLSTYTWSKIDLSGQLPPPRSGCLVFSTPENKILVYGGYSKERIKKDVDKGCVHTDMYQFYPDKHDQTGLKWKSSVVKQSGIHVSPRCSASGILVQPNLAYIFGGVLDSEEDEEDLTGSFFNDLYALDLEKFQWKSVSLSGKKEGATARRRRRKEKGEGDENDEDSGEDETQEPMEVAPTEITDDDGIFTMKIGPAPVTSSVAGAIVQGTREDIFSPSPRINPGLTIKNNTLYLYGGMVEDGNKQITFSDLYSLDFKKLNEWKTIIADDLSTQTWVESSSEGEDSEEGSSTSEDESDEEDRMDVDEK